VGHEGTRVEVRERPAWQANGFVAIGLFVVLVAAWSRPASGPC
jgi:hypothetical protein